MATPARGCLAGVIALLLLTSCHSETACTASAAAGLRVVVLDSLGQRRCDAVVVATSGSFTETLLRLAPTDCEYLGLYERRGTYSVTATTPAGSTQVDGVAVTGDVCHVTPTDLSLTIP